MEDRWTRQSVEENACRLPNGRTRLLHSPLGATGMSESHFVLNTKAGTLMPLTTRRGSGLNRGRCRTSSASGGRGVPRHQIAVYLGAGIAGCKALELSPASINGKTDSSVQNLDGTM